MEEKSAQMALGEQKQMNDCWGKKQVGGDIYRQISEIQEWENLFPKKQNGENQIGKDHKENHWEMKEKGILY